MKYMFRIKFRFVLNFSTDIFYFRLLWKLYLTIYIHKYWDYHLKQNKQDKNQYLLFIFKIIKRLSSWYLKSIAIDYKY